MNKVGVSDKKRKGGWCTILHYGSSNSDNLHLPIPPLFVRKIILTISTKAPFLYTSATFYLPTIYTKNFSLLQSFSQCRLRQRTRELESRMRTNTVLISIFFIKVWKVITGLKTTDSLLLRLRKLVYCRW